MELQLRIAGYQYEILKRHLLPPDGKEAVAVALCGRFKSANEIFLLIHDLTLIPYDECSSRECDILHWPTDRITHYFEKVYNSDLAILKIHSHPGGYNKFSDTDNASDAEFFDSAFGWSRSNNPHASAVMLPEGKIFGRFFFDDLHSEPIEKITVAGDTILRFRNRDNFYSDGFAMRTIQAFGEKTYRTLKELSVGVVGCSGTGSPLIEQLVRLGIGKLVLVDPDLIELKNLNRILNSSIEDAKKSKSKVTVISNSIKKIGLGTKVETHQKNLYDDLNTLRSLVKCDVIFGCVDSVDGRFLLNQLSAFYLVPYIDLGVKIEADGKGGIKTICGSVQYLQPGKSSLITRGVYTMEDVKAASQFRKNPEEYKRLEKEAYIKNVNVNNPAVISINMQIASHAINEFLNRIHIYKTEHPSNYATSTIDITESYIVNVNENDFETDNYLRNRNGRGDTLPFIEMAELQ